MIPLKQFALAGNATFTVSNKATGKRFTFKVSKAKKNPDEKSPRFVSILNGPDNWLNYMFFGTIFLKDINGNPCEPIFRHSQKPEVVRRVSPNAPSAQAFAWLWNHIDELDKFPSIEVRHAGKCGMCGRKLTVPESIVSGIGPECATKMGF